MLTFFFLILVSPSSCGPVAVKLLSALVNVALNLNVSVENNQKLCEVEMAKVFSRRASPRLDKIQKTITEVRQNIQKYC